MSFELILPFFPASIQELILDESISDLCINGDRGVFIERNGAMQSVPELTMDRDSLSAAIEQIARALGRDISEQDPLQDLRLPNGSRVAAVYQPCSPTGATVTIRKFNRWFTTEELVQMGTLPVSVRDTVTNAILNRRNVLISGGTGSGKSTLLSAFVAHVPATDRLIVIEKPMELKIEHANAVRWEAIDELPGRPAVTVARLVAAALRHRPDRIIVGEVRDHSAYDMLQAMNTGHSGSMTTIHADSALLALNRTADLALSAHSNLDHEFVRSQTADALHYVLQISRHRDGRRRVTELVKVRKYDTARHCFEIERLYAYGDVDAEKLTMKGDCFAQTCSGR
ncbi:MAG TPA: ATPase, T2SS/T4P/T4SS family [Bryobacteraceae bacterium]